MTPFRKLITLFSFIFVLFSFEKLFSFYLFKFNCYNYYFKKIRQLLCYELKLLILFED